MCLAIPGKIMSMNPSVDDLLRTAKVSFSGIIKDFNLSMTPEAKTGDYVLVHVGVAISIVDEQEANKIFSYLTDMGEVDEIEPD